MSAAQIEGVTVSPIDVHHDERGRFAEVFVAGDGVGIAPRQWSVVTSSAGVLRGMHAHRWHDEYFSVISGRATVGLFDLRPESATGGCSMLCEIGGDEPMALVFPPGVVHGWLFHEPTVHLQATSERYVDYHREDNLGCHWSDPELGLAWPFEPTIVSARVDAFGSLDDLRSALFSDAPT